MVRQHRSPVPAASLSILTAASAFVLASTAMAQTAAPPAKPPAPPLQPSTGTPPLAPGVAAPAMSALTPVPEAPQPPVLPVMVSDEIHTEHLSFDRAVQKALDKNPTVREADEEIRRTHALMEEVRAASLPTIYGYGTYTRLDHDRSANGTVFEPIGALNLNVTVTIPVIYTQGWVRWAEAGDQIDVARANAADVRRQLALTTGRTYLTIITQKHLVDTARTARDNAKAHYEFTRTQRIGGVGNRLDEARAAQEFTADEVNLQNQEIALVRAREALGVLVAINGPVDVADEETPSQVPTLNEATNGTESLRADVLARKRAAKAADRTVDDAWADYMPWLSVLGYPFINDPGTVTAPGNGWEAQVLLTVPFYDGGLRYGQEHQRKAFANETHLDVEETLRQAKSDVRVAFESIQRADVALEQANQSAAFAARALELANLAYRAGATTNLEVIDAERQARDAENQAAIAQDASREARLDLLSASGHFP
jgi:outer membrane protein